MITGKVTGNEALIKLDLRGPRGCLKVDAVIDTGYNGSLTLAPQVIARLGLVLQGSVRGILADGSESIFDVYEATAVWDGKTRVVPVSEADATPLVGMRMLRGFELNIQVRAGGRVVIRPLPTKKRS